MISSQNEINSRHQSIQHTITDWRSWESTNPISKQGFFFIFCLVTLKIKQPTWKKGDTIAPCLKRFNHDRPILSFLPFSPSKSKERQLVTSNVGNYTQKSKLTTTMFCCFSPRENITRSSSSSSSQRRFSRILDRYRYPEFSLESRSSGDTSKKWDMERLTPPTYSVDDSMSEEVEMQSKDTFQFPPFQ